MPFTRDMSEYVVKRMIPMLLHNAYANPEETDRLSATKRVLSLPTVRWAMSTIGLDNIYPSRKEYLLYLMMKFRLYSPVLRQYSK